MQSKTTLHGSIRLFISLLLLFSFAPVQGQPPLATRSVFDYLTAQEGAALTLELDLTELINKKNTNQYFPGIITTADGNILKMEARPRGKFRRKICEMPPVKLKFSKKELRANGLDTLNEIKLVVPCMDDPNGEELVLREYVAYQMFERINPEYSVRARLVKVAFRDRHVEQTRRLVWCLLIEHEEQVAARLRGKIMENYNMPSDSLCTEQVALNAMFQYMIGNTDWDLSTFRNVYLLKPAQGGKIGPVPFDFDFSGLVSAPYASANATTGLKNVQERLLVSGDLSAAALRTAAAQIQAVKADLLVLCNQTFLSKNTSKDLNRYIESYFATPEAKAEPVVKLR